MNHARHCELCDHQKTSLQQGTTCGLTDQKPDFNNTCMHIALNDKFEYKLKQVNIVCEDVKRRKPLTMVYFVVFLLIGLAVIGGGYWLGKYALDGGVISTVPIIIMGVGIAPLGMGFGALNKYRQDMEAARDKKAKVDEVLAAYRIEYDIDIQFGQKIHGDQEVYADLKTKGIR